jgi:7-carboxy-7-deazaguanine synthase (Cx14CxxC type)
VCRFCDTDFVGVDGPGGGRFKTADELAAQVAGQWRGTGRRYVVCTGGEPLLQLDEPLLNALHAHEFEVAIETNGTIPVPAGVDWVCVSPKIGSRLQVTAGDELKLVYPQVGGEPEQFSQLAFRHFFLQPMDGESRVKNTQAVVDYCLEHPQWRLSVQTHKVIGIP